jgi:DNA-directed RNA polymerase subunit N (RpoN/RPB10)
MNFLKNLKNLGNQIWEPVLKPVRSPTCGDTLGQKYVSSNECVLYRRQDATVTSVDSLELRFTCYLRHKPSYSNLQSSLSLEEDLKQMPLSKPALLNLKTSIEGTLRCSK